MAYIFIYQFRILFVTDGSLIIYSYSVLSGNWFPIAILWWRGITWWCIIWWCSIRLKLNFIGSERETIISRSFRVRVRSLDAWIDFNLKASVYLLLRLILSWSWLKTGIVNNNIWLWLHDWLNWCWSCDNCCLRMSFFIFVSFESILIS